MRLKRDYKEGTFVKFKWYDNWRDEFENPNNFKVIEGHIEVNEYAFNEVIVHDGHENKFYAVPCENIVKEF